MQLYRIYYLYYLVLFSSSYLCAVNYDYFPALTQILLAPCNTNVIGVSCRFPPLVAPQEPMLALLICHLLPLMPPPHPPPVQSSPSNPSCRSGPSLQSNFYHTVKIPEGLISPIDLIISLPQLKIERKTMNPRLIQSPLPSLPLFRPCTAFALPSLLS